MGILAPGAPKPKLTPQQQYAADDEMVRAYQASKAEAPRQGAVLGAPATDQQMADKGYEVQIDPNAPAEPPWHPAVAAEDSAGQDATQGVIARLDAEDAIFGDGMPRAGVAGTAQSANEDMYKVGGAHGASDWENTFVTKPKEIDAAVMETARQEGLQAEAKGDFWRRTQQNQAQELAVLQARRLERQQEIDAQQQHIQQATERYSNDLADRGQFWKNPAHIIGAIGASLMALGSGGPTIGIKLINDAVNADFQERKAMADMHLGELRSNLGSYRQIAGDKEMGDKLGLAESYRVAAMELERIGAQFQGPIAKARAQAGVKDLLMQKQVLMMKMYHDVPYQPAAIVDPRLASARASSPGYNGFGTGAKASPGATSGQSRAPGGVSGQTMTGQPTNPAMDHVLRGLLDKIPDDKLAAWESRSPGSSAQVERERMHVARKIWRDSGGNPAEFRHMMAAFQKSVDDDIPKISAALMPISARIGGFRRMGTDIDLIEMMAGRLKKSPDDLLGNGKAAVFGAPLMASYNDTMHTLFNGADTAGKNKYARELQETENAVERFKQLLAGNQNVYIKNQSGSAVNPTENLRNKGYLREGWRGIKVFHDNESKAAQDEYVQATNSTAHPISGTLAKISVGGNSNRLDRKGIDGPPEIDESGAQGAIQRKADGRQRTIQRAIEAVKK